MTMAPPLTRLMLPPASLYSCEPSPHPLLLHSVIHAFLCSVQDIAAVITALNTFLHLWCIPSLSPFSSVAQSRAVPLCCCQA